jgi:tetratricopeptide (TPR) repeat protein
VNLRGKWLSRIRRSISMGPAILILALQPGIRAQVTAVPTEERLAEPLSNSKTEAQWLSELTADRQATATNPRNAERYLTLGRALHALGENDSAAKALDHALELQPGLAEALVEQGAILADAEKWPQALGMFRRATELAPNLPAAHLWLGDMLLRTGDFTGAGAEFTTILRLDPGNSGAYQGLGLVAMQQGNFDQAAQAFRQALAIRPEYIDAEEGLAHALTLEHQWQEVADLLSKLVAVRPASSADAVDYGTVLARLGDRTAAEEQFSRARELSDQELILLRTKGENNWGITLRSEHRNEEAEAAFRRALDDDPGFCEAHDNLGGVLWLQNNAASATSEFRAAVSCNPHLASAHNNLGTVLLYSSHDLDGAIREFRTAVTLQPGLALAHLNLGKALAARQMLAAAEPEFRTVIALDPGQAAAHVGLGLVLADEKNRVTSEARAELDEGLRLDPGLRSAIPQQYLAQLP